MKKTMQAVLIIALIWGLTLATLLTVQQLAGYDYYHFAADEDRAAKSEALLSVGCEPFTVNQTVMFKCPRFRLP